MRVEITWLEWVSSRSGTLEAFAVPTHHPSHVITGARVPRAARPADPKTPRDANCVRLLDGLPAARAKPGAESPAPRPKPAGRAGKVASDPLPDVSDPLPGTFERPENSRCGGCRAVTRWEPVRRGSFLECASCGELFPCKVKRGRACTHLDCADARSRR